MRTTVSLDDDVYQVALTLAKASDKTLGQVLSELARSGLKPSPTSSRRGALPVFAVRPDTPMIRLDAIRKAWQEE